jgi:hypothetical protein
VTRKLIVLLGGCALIMGALEIGSSWMFVHLRSNRSLRDEIHAATTLTTTPDEPRPVLIVGNSLVLHGIDTAAADVTLGPTYRAHKVAIVDSGFHDWLYGVASLFDRGSQPDVVVLGISPVQLVTDRPPTGSTARLVWTARNLTHYAIDTRAGLSAASDLYFEHLSEFFALRNQVRQDSRKLIVPGYVDMSRDFFTRKPTIHDPAGDEPIAEARLHALDAVCRAHHARFVYLLIPTHSEEDAALEQTVIEAGRRAGVPVLVPMPNRTLDPALLLDGYHLSPSGAMAFSARAGAALHTVLTGLGSGDQSGS